LVVAQRVSIRTFRPSIQPNSARRPHAALIFGIVCGGSDEHADAPHPLALLRAPRKRRCRRAAERG
jgi:hypothetical protein